MNVLLEKDTPLTSDDKALFAHFGEGSKIRPPFRVLNPQNIVIGDFVSIRENAYIHAYTDLSSIHQYIEQRYQGDFDLDSYRYDSKIVLGNQIQIGPGVLISCTMRVELEDGVVFSHNVYVGDNNHTFAHPKVPIMQQPNQPGRPVRIGTGSWLGFGACVLPGTTLGRNTVVGAQAVVHRGEYPDYAVIGSEKAKVLFIQHPDNK
jgi:acetyltransferase-like isoleucine patch superfamily enzyme